MIFWFIVRWWIVVTLHFPAPNPLTDLQGPGHQAPSASAQLQ